MSLVGPSRHFAAAQQLGRFQVKADNKWQAGPAGSVANDPTETLVLTQGSRSMHTMALAMAASLEVL
jgi:hypothetical protein